MDTISYSCSKCHKAMYRRTLYVKKTKMLCATCYFS